MDFHFQNFSLHHDRSTLKIGTDSVLFAASVPVRGARRVLDIGCGCGVIGFCIADRLLESGATDFHVTGIDIDAPSVDEATSNKAAFASRKSAHCFDFQQVPLQELVSPPFDLIVSNPPFFHDSLKPEDSKRLQSKHSDGNLPFEVLAKKSSELLSDNGRFYLILPYAESIEFQEIAKSYFFLRHTINVIPVTGKPVNRRILGFSKMAGEGREEELLIREAPSKYSRQYLELTGKLLQCRVQS